MSSTTITHRGGGGGGGGHDPAVAGGQAEIDPASKSDFHPPAAQAPASAVIAMPAMASAGAEDSCAAYRIPCYLALNAMSSIGIVFMNKVVFEWHEFRYGTLLTLLHFVVTFLGLEICRQFGVFERKPLKLTDVLPLSLSFCGFVVLTNLSLVHNTVGFYQLMKVLTTPIIVVIQTIWYGETFPLNIKLSLVVTCVGVAVASVSDPSMNFLGTLIALSALLVTSQYQIWVGTKQKELECNSYQLLYYQAPLSAIMLIPVVPLFDPISNLTEMPSIEARVAIFASCLLAFLVNLSIFLVIGKTSPVTYNVLGHFKLTVILIGGFVLFGQALDPKNITGILVTLAGVFWYTHLKQTQAAVKK